MKKNKIWQIIIILIIVFIFRGPIMALAGLLISAPLYILLTILPIVIITTFISSFGYLIGNCRSYRKLKKEIRKVEITNPYLYYREIPDDYGIGVYALLLDYKINIRDFKAALIDLSAKGYIKINTTNKSFNITILPKDQSPLLSNEKFILEWITTNKKLKSFNLKEWETKIMDDALQLGLANPRPEAKLITSEQREKSLKKVTFFLTFILDVAYISLRRYFLLILKKRLLIQYLQGFSG